MMRAAVSDNSLPMSLLEAILSRFDRPKLEAVAEFVIDRLDALDPPSDDDPDFRPGACRDSQAGDPGDEEDADPDYCIAGDDAVMSVSALPVRYVSPDLSDWDDDFEPNHNKSLIIDQVNGDKSTSAL